MTDNIIRDTFYRIVNSVNNKETWDNINPIIGKFNSTLVTREEIELLTDLLMSYNFGDNAWKDYVVKEIFKPSYKL